MSVLETEKRITSHLAASHRAHGSALRSAPSRPICASKQPNKRTNVSNLSSSYRIFGCVAHLPSNLLLWLCINDKRFWVGALSELFSRPEEESPVLSGDAGFFQLI